MTLRVYLWLGASALALSAGLGLAPKTAQAACVLVGSTVTCDGTDDDGFTGGNNLALNVTPGSFVQSVYDGNPSTFCPSFRAAIRLGTNARVSNAGQILGRGNCGLGIDAGNGLVLTNDGDIRTDSEVAYAILAGNTFDITNRGTIRTVNASSVVVVGISNGRFLNAAGGVVETTGTDAPALFMEDSNTITNNGTIRTTGSGGGGVDAGASNTITNTGTISATGIASLGIRGRGAGNTITNSGTISTLPTQTPRDGENSIGIQVDNDFNTITNSGTISGDYAGVQLLGNGNTFLNSGTISARAPITTTPGGAIVINGNGSTVTNSSAIRGNGSAAIRVTGQNTTITNNGQITGDVILGGGSNTLTMGNITFITGLIDGRAGTNKLNLQGSGGVLSNTFLGRFDVEKTGVGSWLLGGDLALNGNIRITGGDLVLRSSFLRAASMLIDTQGSFGGIGTITGASSGSGFLSTTVTNAGTLNPGTGGIGDLTISGALTQTRTARMIFDVSGAGTSDRISVGGNVALDGELVLRSQINPVRNGQTFTLINVPVGAGTIAGSFATVTDSSPYFINSVISVTNNAVTLNVQRTPYASVAQTPEEAGIGRAFDRAVAAGSDTLGFATTIDGMTAAQAQAVFASLTTDSPVAAQTWNVLAAQSTTDALSPWLDLGSDDRTRGTWRSWGNVLARDGETGAKTDSGHFDYDIKGVSAGVDYAVADNTRIGLTASHVDGETFFATGTAKNDLSSTSLGLYVAHNNGTWFAKGGGLIGDGSVTATRLTGYIDPLALVTGNLSSKADTDTQSVFAEAGYIVAAGTWQIKPTAGLNYVHAKVDALTEAVTTGLIVQGEKVASLRGDVGLRANTTDGPVRLSVAAFWSQDLKDDDRTARARLVGLPGSDFLIIGRAEKRGWLKTQAGASMDLTPALTAHLNWTGILNDRLGGHAASAGLSYRW